MTKKQTTKKEPTQAKKWCEFKALATGAVDLYIYDEIGGWGYSALDFIKDLPKDDVELNIKMNSPGGDVFDGIAIYNALRARTGVTN